MTSSATVIALACVQVQAFYRLQFNFDAMIDKESHSLVEFNNANKTTFFEKVKMNLHSKVVMYR